MLLWCYATFTQQTEHDDERGAHYQIIIAAPEYTSNSMLDERAWEYTVGETCEYSGNIWLDRHRHQINAQQDETILLEGVRLFAALTNNKRAMGIYSECTPAASLVGLLR